jgi:Cu-Zn family superoxide dismutase
MPVRCRSAIAAVAAAVTLLAGGCASSGVREGPAELMPEIFGEPSATAITRIQATAGSRVEGRVTFAQFGPVLVIRASFIGLAPNREYGLHVHERGDCRDNGAAAGQHFNPGGAPHGRPGRGAHHAGDLPNLRTDGEGNVAYLFQTTALSLAGGPNGVTGRSVLVSRDADDYQSQPDGNGGPPLACGFIRLN